MNSYFRYRLMFTRTIYIGIYQQPTTATMTIMQCVDCLSRRCFSHHVLFVRHLITSARRSFSGPWIAWRHIRDFYPSAAAVTVAMSSSGRSRSGINSKSLTSLSTRTPLSHDDDLHMNRSNATPSLVTQSYLSRRFDGKIATIRG